MSRLSIQVGPVVFDLHGDLPETAPELGPVYPVGGEIVERLAVRLRKEDGPPYIPLPPPYSGARHEFNLAPDADAPETAVVFESYFSRGRMPLGMGEVEVVWRQGPEDQMRLILHNIVRHCAALRLPRLRLLMLHAGGFLVEGRAVLFTGVSGAGKSTATGFAAAQYPVLGDDIVALDFRDRAPRVLTLPALNPKKPPTAGPGSHPLALICTLKKSQQVTLHPLTDPAVRLSRLISQSPFVNVVPGLAETAMDLLAPEIDRLPVAELSLRKDADFLPVLVAAVPQSCL